MTGSLDSSSVVPRIQRAEVFGRLRLTAGKAAELCGITRRQLCYWTDKGIIPCVSGGGGRDPSTGSGSSRAGSRGDMSRRIYDFNGLRKALMLKRLMDEGRGLRRAVRELKARWTEPPTIKDDDQSLGHEHVMLAQAERLSRLGDKARRVGAARAKREMLVHLALALQPLAVLSRGACDGHIAITDGSKLGELKSLLAEAERAIEQMA